MKHKYTWQYPGNAETQLQPPSRIHTAVSHCACAATVLSCKPPRGHFPGTGCSHAGMPCAQGALERYHSKTSSMHLSVRGAPHVVLLYYAHTRYFCLLSQSYSYLWQVGKSCQPPNLLHTHACSRNCPVLTSLSRVGGQRADNRHP